MESLNDDCVLEIMQYLQLQDQISFFLAGSFQDVIRYHWCKKYATFCWDPKVVKLNDEQLRIFLENISSAVEEFYNLTSFTNKLSVLMEYIYPNVTILECGCDCECNETFDISRSFPNVTHFTPCCVFFTTATNFANFKRLQYLDIRDCCELPFSYVQLILEQSQLKSIKFCVFEEKIIWNSEKAFKNFCNLEQIWVNSTEFKWLENLAQFAKLAELMVIDEVFFGELVSNAKFFDETIFDEYYNEDWRKKKLRRLTVLLQNVCEHKQNSLVYMKTLGVNYLRTPGQCNFKNLKKIDLNYVKIDDYSRISECVPCLRELIFEECIVEKSSKVMDLLINSDRIEYINIEHCRFFMETFVIEVGKLDWQRSTPLTFNFYSNFYEESMEDVRLEIKDSNSLFKLTDSNTPLSPEALLHLKFEA